MKATINWIREFTPVNGDPRSLAEAITLQAAEVENLERLAVPAGVVVGRILGCERDPNLKKITWCAVDVGREKPWDIACGAGNVRAGIDVPVALPGTELPGGMEVGTRPFRGRVSSGMICSERELGLGEDHEGIWVLSGTAAPGTPFEDYLKFPDWVLDVDVTPNRPDLFGVLGLAREVGARSGSGVEDSFAPPACAGPPTEELTDVLVEDEASCPRYCARLIRGVKISPSPDWLQKRLEACGIRSINNVVDATNYIMLAVGQPLHAFDFSLLRGGRIVVRRGRPGEKIVSIDGSERQVDADMLVIADAERPVALAGIMGGKDSEVSEETVDLFLESAHFEYRRIRRTSRRLGLSTESSRRFERIVDPNLAPVALERLTSLILETAGGRASSGMIDTRPEGFPRREVKIDPARAAAFLGVPLTPEDVVGFLSSIGLEKRGSDRTGIVFSIPTWRPDLEREADLFEEVARLYGYNRVPEILPCCPLGHAVPSRQEEILARIREFFCGRGLDEVVTYSFISSRNLENLGLPSGHPLREAPSILNPVNKEQNLLRTSLIPGLLDVTGLNQRRKAARIRCFETGTVFRESKDGGKPLEKFRLAAVLAPGKALSHWADGEAGRLDFFSIKGLVEDLCGQLKTAAPRYLPLEDPIFQPGQTAALLLGDSPAGVMGTVSDLVTAAAGLEGPVFLAELDLERLLAAAVTERKYRRLPEYPAVERDIALLVDRELSYGTVGEIVEKLRPSVLESYALFDIYAGDQIPSGKKSLAIHLIYRSPDGTLDDKTVSSLHDPFIAELLRETQGKLR